MNPGAVWVDSTAEGRMTVSMPQAEMTGSATVKEHCPKQEISWMVRSFLSMFPMRLVVKTVLSRRKYIISGRKNKKRRPEKCRYGSRDGDLRPAALE